MNALIIDPLFPIVMHMQGPTKRSPTGNRAVQARRQYEQPYWDFEISLRFRDQAQADDFLGTLAFHQGDTALKFDGGPYGDFKSPQFMGYGDGVKTQFFAPRRNLLAPSWIFWVNGVITAATMNEASGMVIFGAAPPLNALIYGMGRNWFKVLVTEESQQTLLSMRDVPFNVFENERLVLTEIA